MSRRNHSIIPVIFLAVALLFNPASAQPRPASHGPVVRAYLTGLDEELNELEYQLRHREINRADYERARDRLTILRRLVERRASERREDLVPEYQVLAEDELGTLGLGREFKRGELFAGAELEGQWKIVDVQFAGARKLARFLALERLPRSETARRDGAREGGLGKTIDPRDVIETIIVREKRPPAAQPPQPTAGSNIQATATAESSAPAQATNETAPAPRPRLQNPRILHIYLPEYTRKARDQRIEGEVAVRALFQRDGRIRKVKVEKRLGFGLDDRAVEAVKRIGYAPARFDGKEVDAQTVIIFRFKLEKVSVYVGAAELDADAKGDGA